MVQTNKKIPRISSRVIHLYQLSCPNCKEVVVEQEEDFVKGDRFKCEDCGLVIQPDTRKKYTRRRSAWKENELNALIVKTLKEKGPLTNREIVKTLRCSRKLASNSVRELISQGAVEERERWKLYLRED